MMESLVGEKKPCNSVDKFVQHNTNPQKTSKQKKFLSHEIHSSLTPQKKKNKTAQSTKNNKKTNTYNIGFFQAYSLLNSLVALY